MELKEIIKALLWIVSVSALGLSGLTFWTYFQMRAVPKNQRNLMEYQKIKQYVRLGLSALAVAALALAGALML